MSSERDPHGAEDWVRKSEAWVCNERIYDHVFAPFTEVLLHAADIDKEPDKEPDTGQRPGPRVLDVGCGAGTVLERAVACGVPARQVVGVDIDATMVDAARTRVPGATVTQVDAQTGDLPGGPEGFDRVLSRFGVMFFPDPVAAFANIRRHCATGARLTFVSWHRDEKDMFHLGMRRAAARAERVGGVPVTGPRPNRPGALGLADREWITEVLRDAGWVDITVERVESDVSYGMDGSSGVEERLAVACAGNVGLQARRILEPAGEWDAALDDARAELIERLDSSGTLAVPAVVWLVTATAGDGTATPAEPHRS